MYGEGGSTDSLENLQKLNYDKNLLKFYKEKKYMPAFIRNIFDVFSCH
jgi:hypothetical protein